MRRASHRSERGGLRRGDVPPGVRLAAGHTPLWDSAALWGLSQLYRRVWVSNAIELIAKINGYSCSSKWYSCSRGLLLSPFPPHVPRFT